MQKQLLFSGHMIDAPNRKLPRFPASRASGVEKQLYQKLKELRNSTALNAISSAAAGGDIIFHELCVSLGIPSQIYLPCSPEVFRLDSVDFVGGDWGARFERLINMLPYHILKSGNTSGQENIYSATNNWMLGQALQNGKENMLLLALWNGEKGDGGGGTWEMVAACRELGAEVQLLHP